MKYFALAAPKEERIAAHYGEQGDVALLFAARLREEQRNVLQSYSHTLQAIV